MAANNLKRKNNILVKSFLGAIDKIRINSNILLNSKRKEKLSQYFTDTPTAKLMTKMIKTRIDSEVNIMEPGAGTGILTAALIYRFCLKNKTLKKINVTLYEKDRYMKPYIEETFSLCSHLCEHFEITLSYKIIIGDFIKIGCELTDANHSQYDVIIMNPPYKKIKSISKCKEVLSNSNIETTNYYSAFLLLSTRYLKIGGQLVAITPRSFCSGSYYTSFRKQYLNEMCFRRFHLFDSRSQAFSSDKVLQENIIFHCVKKKFRNNNNVLISTSNDPLDKNIVNYTIKYNELVKANDSNMYIRIVKDLTDLMNVRTMERLTTSLDSLGITVSTGKVVDFRMDEHIRKQASSLNLGALIYPFHFNKGKTLWPMFDAKKPDHIEVNQDTLKSLVNTGYYVLVKRFSTKEERRRIVSVIFDPTIIMAQHIGFENHINYYHCNGNGLPKDLAKGLSLFLNSSIVDKYFRQFNGHTQVNVTDLKAITYPTKKQLLFIGTQSEDILFDQKAIDKLIEKIVFFI